MQLNSGDRIDGRYQVLRRIGEGGMSNIYLCQSLAPPGSPTAGQWVIKEMTVSYRDPEDQKNAVRLFDREAELLKQLRHRNLPRVVDKFVVGNRYYTVMEYVEGEDLGKMLLRNPNGFAEPKVIAWGIEIATVLYYLHSQKPPIIFRDLKPSNIMISRGQVKLIDFGIARRFDPFKKKDTMRIGSPGYAPPEQYSGQTDRRSDIYALGVTLHQLLSGRDPSETQTPFKLPSVRSFKPTVSAALEAIIVQATELDPQKRFKTALDMKRALQGLVGVQSGPLPTHTAPVPSVPLPAAPGIERSGAGRSGTANSVPPRLGPPAIPTPSAQAPHIPADPNKGPASNNRAANPYARGGASPVSPPAMPVVPPPASGAATSAPAYSPMSAVGGPPLPVAGAPAPFPAAAGPRPPSSVSMPHNAPLAQRASRLPLLFVLLALGLFGYRYQAEILKVARFVGIVHPSFHAPSSGEASPAPLPTEPLQRALTLLDVRAPVQVDAALDIVEDIRRKDRSNGLALLAYNNGLVMAAQQSGGAVTQKSVLQVVYTDDALGKAWLRGVALAQRDINATGGVQGHLLLLAPQPLEDNKPDADALTRAAGDDRAVAVLIDLPSDRVAALSAAYAPLPVINTLPRNDGSVGASGPPTAEMLAAMTSYATSTIKPVRVAIVDDPTWAKSELATVLQAEFHKARGDAVTAQIWTDGQENVAAVAAFHPDLVVFLGDAWALDRFARQARKTLTAPVLCGGGALAETFGHAPSDEKGGALADWMKGGRLFAVSPYDPTSDRAARLSFDLSYRHTYGVTSGAGVDAATGFDMLNGMAAAMDNPDAQWTASGVQGALNAATPRPTPTMSGVYVGGGSAEPLRTWYVLKVTGGVPSVAKVVRL